MKPVPQRRQPVDRDSEEYGMAGIMDSIRNLFGGRSASGPPQAANEPDTYKDCLIYAEPMAEGGQWRLAGRIVKGDGEAAREHKFIRADIFSSRDDVEAATYRKARQIIDEQGEALFQ
mgnify:CR=1 FL=1